MISVLSVAYKQGGVLFKRHDAPRLDHEDEIEMWHAQPTFPLPGAWLPPPLLAQPPGFEPGTSW